MRKLNRAEHGTYTQFMAHKNVDYSNTSVDDCVELAYEMDEWLRGHFVRVPMLKLALGIRATKNGGKTL